jgi:hypothetical protein
LSTFSYALILIYRHVDCVLSSFNLEWFPQKIRETVEQSDIVINTADADDLPLTRAVLQGLTTRAKNQRGLARSPILIHTSGTGVVTDKAEGEFLPSTRIYNVRLVIPHGLKISNQLIPGQC